MDIGTFPAGLWWNVVIPGLMNIYVYGTGECFTNSAGMQVDGAVQRFPEIVPLNMYI